MEDSQIPPASSAFVDKTGGQVAAMVDSLTDACVMAIINVPLQETMFHIMERMTVY